MKVIFDTDPGIDDATALIYLHALRSQIELLGITTVVGNASIEDCTLNARHLCDVFKIAAPVYQGAGTTITGASSDHYPDFVHGKNGMADIDIPEPKTPLQPQTAAEFLVESAIQHSGELTLLAVGRLTNLALAIQADDAFADNLHEIIIMGGAWQHEGNVSPFAEANIYGDPEAAQAVFECGVPLTMVGLDVTMKTKFSKAYLKEICDQLGPVGEFLFAINEVYMQYYGNEFGWDESPVHDPSAIAYAEYRSLFTTVRGQLSCVLEGEQRGRTIFTETEEGPHQVCIDVDSDALTQRYRSALLNAR